MKVGIIQPNYMPWRGYFDFIDDVDLFIFYDDLQYTTRDWRNRNKIKTDRKAVWLTVPVHCKRTSLICGTTIDRSQPWNQKHMRLFEFWYGKAPFFSRYRDELSAILGQPFETISDLDIALCRWIMDKLAIKTPLCCSSEFKPQGAKTERLIDLLKKVGATSYLSGPAARDYLDESLFLKNRITLEYKSYDYRPYPQLWGDFMGEVTVLDLLFNTGPGAREHLKSLTPNRVAAAA